MGARASVVATERAAQPTAENAKTAPPPKQMPRSPPRATVVRRRNLERPLEASSRLIPGDGFLAPVYVRTTAFGPGHDVLREAPPGWAPGAAAPAKLHAREWGRLRGGSGLSDVPSGAPARLDSSVMASRVRSASLGAAPTTFKPYARLTRSSGEGVIALSERLPIGDPRQLRRRHTAAVPVYLPPLLPATRSAHPSPYAHSSTAKSASAFVPAVRAEAKQHASPHPASRLEALCGPHEPSAGAECTQAPQLQRQSGWALPNEMPQRNLSFSYGDYALQSWLPPFPEHREKRVGRGFSNGSPPRRSTNLLTDATTAAAATGEASHASSTCSTGTGATESVELRATEASASERVRRGSAISFNETVSVASDRGDHEEALLRRGTEAPYRGNLARRMPLTMLGSSLSPVTSTNTIYGHNGVMFLH